MKYFSISFFSDKKDVPKQNFLFDISIFQNPAMKMRIIITIAFAAMMFMMSNASVAAFMIISFLAIPAITSSVYNNSYLSSIYKSKTMKRPVTVDFYGDHLVFTLERDLFYKGKSERHMPFDKLENIFDFNDAFIFSFKNESGINIPKRVLTPEQTEMIYNLVDNLFKNKYLKINK